MYLTEMPLIELRRAIRATEAVAGAKSISVEILRRELARRRAIRQGRRPMPTNRKANVEGEVR